jgi:hypothetical protein
VGIESIAQIRSLTRMLFSSPISDAGPMDGKPTTRQSGGRRQRRSRKTLDGRLHRDNNPLGLVKHFPERNQKLGVAVGTPVDLTPPARIRTCRIAGCGSYRDQCGTYGLPRRKSGRTQQGRILLALAKISVWFPGYVVPGVQLL